MIKIIKQGTIEKKIATCPECGCVFSFWKEDIQEEFNKNINVYYSPLLQEYVKCPCCNNHVTDWREMKEGEEELPALPPSSKHNTPV